MERKGRNLSRRDVLKLLGAAGSGLGVTGFAGWDAARAREPQARSVPKTGNAQAVEAFTGPGANPHWNSVGPIVVQPEKAPLILLTDRPMQLETPRHYFAGAFTPNDTFYVRWHLAGIPNGIDLKEWKLKIEGNVAKPQTFTLT